MSTLDLNPIGEISMHEGSTTIQVAPKYRKGLEGLEGFSHLVVLWWFSEFADEQSRAVLEVASPYKNSPEVMGIFATRSPLRTNPIGLTVVQILAIDYENGIIQIPYIDAHHGTPVLDLKPYTPSFDRIENPQVPQWCANWPKSSEASGDFDWESVFNF